MRETLGRGAKCCADLRRETGSSDGRELALALEELRAAGKLNRLPDGEYALAPD